MGERGRNQESTCGGKAADHLGVGEIEAVFHVPHAALKPIDPVGHLGQISMQTRHSTEHLAEPTVLSRQAALYAVHVLAHNRDPSLNEFQEYINSFLIAAILPP